MRFSHDVLCNSTFFLLMLNIPLCDYMTTFLLNICVSKVLAIFCVMCFKEYYEHSCKCVNEHLYELLSAVEWLNHKVSGKLL